MPLTLTDLENFTLDSIITRHRDKVSLGLADAAEIADIAATIPDATVKDTIDQWHLIAYRSVGHPVSILLLGNSRHQGTTWITSSVQQIDSDHGIVRTFNSHYKLGEPGGEIVPIDQLFLLVTSMRRYGLQNLLGLPDVSG